MNIVRYIFLPRLHKCLYHRMPAGLDIQGKPVTDFRTAISVFRGQFCKPGQNIQLGNHHRVLLNGPYSGLYLGNQRVIDSRLECVDFVLGGKNLLFIFLKFLSNIPFCIDKSLFADPFLRDFVLVGVADLDVITEDIVVTYFQ